MLHKPARLPGLCLCSTSWQGSACRKFTAHLLLEPLSYALSQIIWFLSALWHLGVAASCPSLFLYLSHLYAHIETWPLLLNIIFLNPLTTVSIIPGYTKPEQQSIMDNLESLNWLSTHCWYALVKTCLVTNKESEDKNEIKETQEHDWSALHNCKLWEVDLETTFLSLPSKGQHESVCGHLCLRIFSFSWAQMVNFKHHC